MKKLYYIMAMAWMGCLAACTTSMPEYSDPVCGLRFENAKYCINYTFLYDDPKVVKDTVIKVTVRSIGLTADYDRPFLIRQVQIEGDTMNAEVNEHYLSIDSKECYIPAGEATREVPIRLLNASSLKDTMAYLRLELVGNENFSIYMPDSSRRDVQIANMPVKPDGWDNMTYYYGDYGTEKHRFLIQATGERWDAEFLQTLYYNYVLLLYTMDQAWLKLEALNEERDKQGLPPLSEKDGTVVVIPKH